METETKEREDVLLKVARRANSRAFTKARKVVNKCSYLKNEFITPKEYNARWLKNAEECAELIKRTGNELFLLGEVYERAVKKWREKQNENHSY